MQFTIGTTSEIKLAATKKVLSEMMPEPFEVSGIDSESGVPPTPRDEQTLMGARNRALYCKDNSQGEYWIGLESGLVERWGNTFEEAWACVIDSSGKEYLGFSSGLVVPNAVLEEMKKTGEEHNVVMRKLRKNPDGPKDTWSDYTGGSIIRSISLEEALRNATIQIFAPAHSYYHH